ncbi:flagellin [Cognatilysobacter xinjiangensis]|nr:flagellin [Lysobacter xinjiangensis]
MSVINTNVMSLNAQRNLTTSGSSLATSIQRLSSGLRINSAKDDAAGLAISERMTSQIRGMDQAARNANDGISLAQTAEGALGEIGNNLQRIRELAVQSRNATNSAEDREALQKEVSQLTSEIDRVAKTTSFNGTKLLDGSFTAKSFQVGANQGETIDVDAIANAQMDALGSWTSVSYQEAKVTVTAANLVAPTVGNGADAAAGGGDDTQEFAATSFTINGTTVNVAAYSGAAGGTAADARTARLAQVRDAVNNASIAGVSAGLNATTGDLELTSSAAITITNGTNVATTGLATAALATVAGSPQTGFEDLDISTVRGADNAILAMDAALKSVNGARADLGAIQNRFSSVVSNLNTTSENLTASRSRIRDADYAKETAELSRTQILQQAGTAMLAQANQATQGVLSLLR